MIASILLLGTQDQIWVYGFSYNIARGLIPYKDFNMVIGPLYSWLFALPIKIFGNYLIYFKAFHVLIYSAILAYAAYKVDKKLLFLIGIMTIQCTMSFYNAFVCILIILIFVLIDSKNKNRNLYIGLIIGIIAMIKHNIAVPLFLVYFFTSKEKIKSTLFVSIPVILTFIYFLITNSLMEYIDICLLGMGNFATNLYLESIVPIYVGIVFIYMIKSYLKNKDIVLLYTIAFSIVMFPLIDGNHFLSLLIPLSYYIITREKKKIITLILTYFIALGLITNIGKVFINDSINTKNNFLKYLMVDKHLNHMLEEYTKYINNIEGNVYIFTTDAYIVKIYNNETTTFTDLINRGNLGRDETKYLKEIDKKCKKEKCTFILSKTYFTKKRDSQLTESYKDYVIKNYEFVKKTPIKDRQYSNFKKEKSDE